MDQQKLANLIIEAREGLGMNQVEASLHCGFSETYLGMIERQRRIPGPRALLRIMTRLGIKKEAMREFLPAEFHNLLKPDDEKRSEGSEAASWEAVEQVRERAMGGSGFYELPEGLKELVYDQDTFHDFQVREEELEYLKKVELCGTGGQPTKEGYLLELERLRYGGHPSTEGALLLLKEVNPQLFEIMNKIIKSDEDIRERIIKAIGPAVDAIIEASSFK